VAQCDVSCARGENLDSVSKRIGYRVKRWGCPDNIYKMSFSRDILLATGKF